MIRDYFDRLAKESNGTKELKRAVRSKRRKNPDGHVPRVSSQEHSLALPVSRKLKWKVPVGSWENKIQTIDGCEDAGNGDLIVYATWKGGKKTRHKAQTMHSKCPQKVHFLSAGQTLSFANRSSCFVSTSVLWYFHDHNMQRWHPSFSQSVSSSLCPHSENISLLLKPTLLLSHTKMVIYLG